MLELTLTVPLSGEDITAVLWCCVRRGWCSVAELAADPGRVRSVLVQAFTLHGVGVVDEGDRDVDDVEHAPATGTRAAELAALRALVARLVAERSARRPALAGVA